MSHPVYSASPVTGHHVVRHYAGLGIKGSDIPTVGDNPSPVLDDGIDPNGEYWWRVEVAPSNGTLTTYPDLSYLFDATGVDDGSYPWQYRLYELLNHTITTGTATVTQTVGSSGTQINLAGVGVAVAGGSASASVDIASGGVGLAVQTGSANPSATITLSAAALAQAAGQAGISPAILLAGAGAASAAGNASLATLLNALASGGAVAGGSATISGGAQGDIAGAGSAVAGGSSVLTITVGLQGIGSAVTDGSATVQSSTPGSISAAGGAVSDGSGIASATISVTAAGFVQAMAAGQFVVDVPLMAFGSGNVSGSATLNQSSGSPNGSISDADINRIVAALVPAVIAALNATTIPVNMMQTNSVDLIGDGTEGNKFRSHLVP